MFDCMEQIGRPFNFHYVDNIVSRSAQPIEEQFKWLKDQDVTDIVNFRTMVKPRIDFDEKQVVKDLGMKYHSIPTITAKPNESNIIKFLNLVEKVKNKGGKLHMHCQLGADRTGLYAFIYETLQGIATPASNWREWLMCGHNHMKYPNLSKWAVDFILKYKK